MSDNKVGRQSSFVVTPDTIPANDDQLRACLRSWEWRIFSGQLYKIMVKGDDDEDDGDGEAEAMVLPFTPNRAQRKFLRRLHRRNVILKARQLGMTTLISILWLDHALFNADQRCGIIAHTERDVKVIFRDKVKFAYDNLPAFLKALMPLAKDTEEELLFAHNNSSVRVGLSMRSGTIHRLHISEMGKIAAQFPKKAHEIVTGSFPAVPKSGIIVIESTAEGQSGEFYKIARSAQAKWEAKKQLSDREFRFHFFPWMDDPNYQMSPVGITIPPAQHKYFDEVETYWGIKITLRQRAWYCATMDFDFSGDEDKMKREMPSIPDECWFKSVEGTFYAKQLSAARKAGRIGVVPHVSHVPVNLFWDIGAHDGSAIWFHQLVGLQHRFIDFEEGWDEGYEYYVKKIKDRGHLIGGVFLPHDAQHKRQMKDAVAAPLDMLRELAPEWNFIIVPRVQTFTHGITLTRAKFGEAWFDQVKCANGLNHLADYKKRWNRTLGVWADEPDHDNPHTEAADAFRQWAQGFDPAILSAPTVPSRKKTRSHGGKVI